MTKKLWNELINNLDRIIKIEFDDDMTFYFDDTDFQVMIDVKLYIDREKKTLTIKYNTDYGDLEEMKYHRTQLKAFRWRK